MIFVLGDIHGLSDPLRIAVDYIYHTALEGIHVNKIIFLGDYIDGGPSSKQVVDQIISLSRDFEVITLLGNHEDMLLSYYQKGFHFTQTGNNWLNHNSGLQTVMSFYPQSVLFKQTLFPDARQVSALLQDDNVLVLKPEYQMFFENLTLSHLIPVLHEDKTYELLFCHSIPSPRFALDEQLSGKNSRDLHDYIHTSACSLDETLIWNRQLLASQLRENLTVIHGHTPTKYYRQMTKLLKFWEEEENIPFVQRDKKTRQPAQIDIDTGLVYGGALTMLAINDEPDSQRVFEYYLSIDLKRNLRQNLFTKQELDIRLSKQ